MSDTLIQVRVDDKLKKRAEEVLMAMGIKTSEAIRMFLQQTINDQALPFQPRVNKIPNKTTIAAFDDLEKGNFTDLSLNDFKKSLALETKPKAK